MNTTWEHDLKYEWQFYDNKNSETHFHDNKNVEARWVRITDLRIRKYILNDIQPDDQRPWRNTPGLEQNEGNNVLKITHF